MFNVQVYSVLSYELYRHYEQSEVISNITRHCEQSEAISKVLFS